MDGFVILVSIFGFAMIAFIVVIMVVAIKRLNVSLSKTINGHLVEINTGYAFARLSVDGKVVDEMNSYQMYNAKLVGEIDGVGIRVNIGSGFMGRRITTFVGDDKDLELSN